EPPSFSDSPESFFEAIARDAPVGTYPKYFYGRQTYWTVVGVNGDGHEALINEEGMVEGDKGAFSVEPFLFNGQPLVTWQTPELTQSLEAALLPRPRVARRTDALTLTTSAFAAGPPGASTLYVRYRVKSQGDRPSTPVLFVAIRPFQVLPPWQSLNIVGGTTRIGEIRNDGRVVWVNRDKAV